MRIAVFAAVALLSGCAVTYDVVQTGPNRYQVSSGAAPVRGGIAGAQMRATRAAGVKCVNMGKSVNVISVETGREFPAAGTATVTFECD